MRDGRRGKIVLVDERVASGDAPIGPLRPSGGAQESARARQCFTTHLGVARGATEQRGEILGGELDPAHAGGLEQVAIRGAQRLDRGVDHTSHVLRHLEIELLQRHTRAAPHPHHRCGAYRRRVEKRLEQRALADPCRSGDEDYLPFARMRLREQVFEALELGFAADEKTGL